ncbi:hypothetical protein PSQ39_06400 [Curvibacter sp. HBC28]|uniref:DUF1631 domain-containing protein n=1 Tax=Curvibacter microcysteis TaxID=3026419 RepID=A0ABT5MCF8_9BURK|nr:hypothetical protein [Curvibacter sp. HBC28]MDD0814256.1 hypothetical protein [Curvibacter sp. HBC28]
MEHSTAAPEKAKKATPTKVKTQVGRRTQAANEALPPPAWVLIMRSILRKLADLAMAGMEVEDVVDGRDIYSSRLDRLISVHFEQVGREIEQGLRDSSLVLEQIYDADSMIRGAQAVDLDSPNRQSIHTLMLNAIEAVTLTENREGFDDAELAQIAANLPGPHEVPLMKLTAPVEDSQLQKFVTKATPMTAESKFGRVLLLDATFDIEGAALQLIRRSRELDLPPEDGAELRSIGVRIKDLNSVLMGNMSGNEPLTVGDVHQALYRGAVPFPEGVAA